MLSGLDWVSFCHSQSICNWDMRKIKRYIIYTALFLLSAHFQGIQTGHKECLWRTGTFVPKATMGSILLCCLYRKHFEEWAIFVLRCYLSLRERPSGPSNLASIARRKFVGRLQCHKLMFLESSTSKKRENCILCELVHAFQFAGMGTRVWRAVVTLRLPGSAGPMW